ncbi:carbohydrate-binding module family 14 protein [Kitasatospora sp. NPDC096077]|uniref:carbohydrate-binding module family 14 protein n=1 Tax=Kitasatospora sp. NPDC096077 TaxID=3155544 RepID=UPI00331EE37A
MSETKPLCEFDSQLLPDPTDPSKFYECTSDLQPVEMQCPAGLVFNPETNLCDWPAHVRQITPKS